MSGSAPRRIMAPLGPALLVGVALLAGACASGGGGPAEVVPTAEVPFLAPPAEGWDGTVSSSQAAWLTDLHRDLLAGAERSRILSETAGELARRPAFTPARVLDAQVRFVDRQYTTVLEMLEPVRQESIGYLAAEVLYGRAAEKAGRPVDAFAAYWSVRERSAAASDRVAALEDGVLDALAETVEQQIGAGTLDEARRTLDTMDLYAPEDARTLTAGQSFAAATGDPMALLARLREQTAQPGADPEIVRRRAELELEVGDPAAAVRLAEGLAAGNPADPGLAELLQRAQFTWRLNVLPPEVRRLARDPELTRADYAVLLYWLFPSVRYGRGTEATIATDIIDHDERERIVRVINLGLLDVDSVHRFEPDAPIRSNDALDALLRLLEGAEGAPRCSEPDAAAAPGLCGRAQACGLLASTEGCQSGATLTGPEALELIRRALAGLDSAS